MEGTCLFDNTTIYNNYLTAHRIVRTLSPGLNKAATATATATDMIIIEHRIVITVGAL